MGVLTGQTLGRVSNQIGTVLYQISRGENVVRSMPSHYTDLNSDPQKKQRAKFLKMQNCPKTLYSVIAMGWEYKKKGMTTRNSVLRYNMNNSMSWTGSVWEFIYNKMRFNNGSLKIQPASTITDGGGGSNFDINWSPRIIPGANATDTLIIQIYCPDLDIWDVINTAAIRLTGTYHGTESNELQGHLIHAWGNWTNTNQNRSSDTFYIGFITLT